MGYLKNGFQDLPESFCEWPSQKTATARKVIEAKRFSAGNDVGRALQFLNLRNYVLLEYIIIFIQLKKLLFLLNQFLKINAHRKTVLQS